MSIWVFVLLYLIIQIFIGYKVSLSVSNDEDYFLAGRSLGPLFATFSIFATWFGAETCIGSSSMVYAGGLADTRADPFGFTICLMLMGFLFAKKLWSLGITTIADFYRTRFGDFTEKLAVIVLVPSTLMWAAAQIRAFGQILSIVAPIDPFVAVTVAAAFVILYTFLGGLLGDVITDVFQGSIVILGMFVLLWMTFNEVGGVSAAWEKISPERLSFVKEGESWLSRMDSWLIPIFGSLLAQELISRVLASRSAQIAKKSAILAGFIYLFVGLIPVVLGLTAFDLVSVPSQKDQFLPLLAKKLLHPAVFVVFMGALVSAILSTVDSTLLSISAFVNHNIYGKKYRRMNNSTQLMFSRGVIVASGVAAYIMAVSSESIYDLVVAASAFGAAGTLTITFIGMWFPRFGTQRSSISTLIIGVISHPIFEYILEWEAPFFFSILTSLSVFCFFALFDKDRVKVLGEFV